jgi:hypothetical protein
MVEWIAFSWVLPLLGRWTGDHHDGVAGGTADKNLMQVMAFAATGASRSHPSLDDDPVRYKASTMQR